MDLEMEGRVLLPTHSVWPTLTGNGTKSATFRVNFPVHWFLPLRKQCTEKPPD